MVLFTNTERGLLAKYNNIELFNSGDEKNNSSYNRAEGLVVDATAFNIELGLGEDDEFNDCIIEIINGKGRNQARYITSFTNQIATIHKAFDIIPDSESYFIIHVWGGKLPKQTQANTYSSLLLPDNFQIFDNQFEKCYIKIIEGTSKGEIRIIKNCECSGNIIKLATDWRKLPNENDLYVIYGESGIVQASDSNHITLNLYAFNAIKVFNYVEIYKGTGISQVRMITAYDPETKQIQVDDWDIIPDETSYYNIFGGWCGKYETVLKHAIITVVTDIEYCMGQRVLVSLESSLDSNGNHKKIKIAEISSDINADQHAITVTTKYFRLKLVSMGYSLEGYVQTILNSYKSGKLTALLEEPINENSNCDLNRSVITGKTNLGTYQNISADSVGNLFTSIKSPLDAFGHLSTTEPTQIVDMKFSYNFINPSICKSIPLNGATNTVEKSIAHLNSGTGTGKTFIESNKKIKYNPGIAISVLFTAIFNVPISKSIQLVGYGDECDGVFIGYNELNFGILRRWGGMKEIRVLEISNTATQDENITITLNGINSYQVSILSGDKPNAVVRKILASKTLFYTIGGGWDLYEDNNKIIFISVISSEQTGAYSFNAGASGVSGTFSQTQQGLDPFEEWYYQENWNLDKAFGNEMLPYINFQLGNVYQIDIQWLGFGNITVGVENPNTGYFVPVNLIRYTNQSMTTSLENPNLPLRLYVEKLPDSGVDEVILRSSCMSGFIRGKENKLLGPRFGKSSNYSTTSGGLDKDQYYNILAFRNDIVYKNTTNTSEIMLIAISMAFNNNSVIKRGGLFTFFANPVISNEDGLVWTKRHQFLSIMSTCNQVNAISGGNELISIPVGSDGHAEMLTTPADVFLPPGNTLSLAFKPFNNLLDTDESDITVSLSWIERN